MDRTVLAARPGADLAGAVSAFGSDWLSILIPAAVGLLCAAAIARRSTLPRRGAQRATWPLRLADGAAVWTGLPSWCAGPLVVLSGALIIAMVGFIWDVAWHIVIGRDEFLFSPPHIALLLGVSGIGLAGTFSVVTATRTRAEVGWRAGRWRIPRGAAGLMAGGAAAFTSFSTDELWHWAYGLDVTMWSPPHLGMISAAVFAPLSAWLLYAEAGPAAGRPWVRRCVPIGLAGIALTALSAPQLEFDLGVPQWQQLFQPVLIAVAGGFALTAARAALGRGGALIAVAGFLAVRGLFYLLATQLWQLAEPRFPLYLAAAIAVEAAFVLAPRRAALAAGLGVGTLGLAGAWGFSHVWGWHPWGPGLLPGIGAATLAAVGAAVLGTAFGRVVSHRASGVRPVAVAAGLAAVLAGLAIPLPRTTPDATVTVRTAEIGDGLAELGVTITPADAAVGADRFEVLSWQGGGHQNAALREVAPGEYRADRPVPVTGSWKSLVRIARADGLGGAPVYMPADPAVGAAAVPVAAERTQALVGERELMLREAHDGPAWPGIVAYAALTLAITSYVGLTIAGTVGMERLRRARGLTRGVPPLAGRRILVTGASSGIGRAARTALEAQGARVVGLDLTPDRPDTLVADVRDSATLRAAVDEAAVRLGGLDIVVANAGIGVAADTTAPPDAAARRVLDVNFFGAWETVAAALPHLGADGQVVIVASGLATANVPYAAAYVASKRAVSGYADVLRLETGRRVTVIDPGYIRTAIHDAPAAAGATLDGLVRVETLADAAATVVAACETGRRRLATTPRTTVELWLARRFPALTDHVVRARWQQRRRTRSDPDFTTTPADPDFARTTGDLVEEPHR